MALKEVTGDKLAVRLTRDLADCCPCCGEPLKAGEEVVVPCEEGEALIASGDAVLSGKSRQ
jgi:hypothetical protein